ncbi:NAD-dependent epimerase/dehydratase family protein [Staphylococcus delphini]|uniref:NAD-dependent epimerase/dehydratase family protein n=1 Tax=Staphylococcus delphini TaxID=53344 RepID=UPI0012D2FAE1|nr:NAD-dependent epimerase/dehydratase family protein [Staphylococcus delphini]MTV19282.1 NAD-dependent epimerase/dehydratase family protein [Staphylococcus delphini]
MKKKILMTGTTGYVTRHLASYLSTQGYEVEQISVRNNAWETSSFGNYDVMIHTAALVHNNTPNARFSDYIRVNTTLTTRIAKKAKQEGVKQFIFMSTMAVYGLEGSVGEKTIINEETKLQPRTDYGISKLKAEEKLNELEDDAFKVAIVRPPMIYGANSPGNFDKLRRVAQLLPVLPYINNQRSALYIEHLNRYISELIHLEASGIYHPQDEFYFETTKVMKEIRKILDKRTITVPVPILIYPLLNKVPLFKKIFGHLVYDSNIDQQTTITMNQVNFNLTMQEIVRNGKKA